MPYDLALYDLISPYVLRGDTFGQWHAALSVIYVSEHTVAVDDDGIVIRGVGKYSGDIGRPNFDPKTMTLNWAPKTPKATPPTIPAGAIRGSTSATVCLRAQRAGRSISKGHHRRRRDRQCRRIRRRSRGAQRV